MIRSFSIENFKAIGHAEFGDLAPVNVIAGENGTGKSSVLKLMYAVLYPVVQSTPETIRNNIADKIAGIFNVPAESLTNDLVRSSQEALKFKLNAFDDLFIDFTAVVLP